MKKLSKKAAIYARAACENGSDLIKAAQIRTCKSHADREGLRIDDKQIYTDAGPSGATKHCEFHHEASSILTMDRSSAVNSAFGNVLAGPGHDFPGLIVCLRIEFRVCHFERYLVVYRFLCARTNIGPSAVGSLLNRGR
jgi:hypothetical protein